MSFLEINVDGLVGPTHNYSGLAFGNEASQANAGNVSSPKRAALQGLEKMRLLTRLGLKQMVMPPQPRPDMRFLAQLGFAGIAEVAARAPELLPVCYSAAGMWSANAATVAASADARDGRVHFTPANLICTAHRAMEPGFAGRALARLFPQAVHHAPLPANLLFSDEGAANHMRFQLPDGQGLHVFVFGREHASLNQFTARYPARQTRQAAQAVARLHGLSDARCMFIRQHPKAIDAGVFHNDVIATSNDHFLLYHEDAFAEGDAPVEALRRASAGQLAVARVAASELSLEGAVGSYLFNSQIVTIPGGGMCIIAPGECAQNAQARAAIESMIADAANPVTQVHYAELRESMRNGGGPACLRLRVPLTQAEWAGVHPGAVFTEALHARLAAWVEQHYRDRLHPEDLADPALAEEVRAALTALEEILDLPGLYAS